MGGDEDSIGALGGWVHNISLALFGGYLWRLEQESALSTNERTQPGGALSLLLVAVLMYLVNSTIESPKQANCCRLGVEVRCEGMWGRGV